MHSSQPSLVRRALLALLLAIGFYGLALAVAAFLLSIIYAEVYFTQRINLKLTLVCLLGAGTILWSILPRIDRFAAPGPRLEPEQHPRLFKEVSDIAKQVGQKMPSEVYLIPDVNAFVTERGGIMGIGSRRVMGVGLSLLQTITVPQFRAVIAHEFGHFYGGDTKLGPWIYRTRMAIVRTIQGLGESPLQYPFLLYGKMFLRITHAISRRQEFVADELAAQTVGSRPLIEGLRTIHGTAYAFSAFMQSDVSPVISAGYRPPLVEGFALYLNSPPVAEALSRFVEREVESTETNPYDTHPSLKERISAVEGLPTGVGSEDNTPAISLLDGIPELEQKLFGQLLGEQRMQTQKLIEWSNVGMAVWFPFWEKAIQSYSDSLKGITPASLPQFLHTPDGLATQIQQSADKPLTSEEVATEVANITALALTIVLVRQGWTLDVPPGSQAALSKGETMIYPFDVTQGLASGEQTAADNWQTQCEQIGIANLDLGNI